MNVDLSVGTCVAGLRIYDASSQASRPADLEVDASSQHAQQPRRSTANIEI